MLRQNKEGAMKKIYEKAKAEILLLGKQDIVTLSGFFGKEDEFVIPTEENEEN